MKPFNGYEAKRKATREQLPVGGYVVKVLEVQETENEWGKSLEISFDVAEGPYTDFFMKDYKNQIYEDKKWAGKYYLKEPKDDGSEKDGWTKSTFNNAMYAFEDSNDKFHWNWDESQLKEKIVGALFRNEEWNFNGNTGWKTRCCNFIPAQDVRENNFQMPKDKPLKNKPAPKNTMPAGFEEIVDTDDDLPFSL